MPKLLRNEPIFLASGIQGFRDETGYPRALDLSTGHSLDLYSIDDKITIYQRQVEEWFLNRATSLCSRSKNHFVVIMIVTSYIEGVQQYRTGSSSIGQSRKVFSDSFERIFGIHNITKRQVTILYEHLRCSLFHNGMSGNAIILNSHLRNAIEFLDDQTIHINPRLYLSAVINDFNQYIFELRNRSNYLLRDNFNRMFTLV